MNTKIQNYFVKTLQLMAAINKIRVHVWRQQPESVFEDAAVEPRDGLV